MKERPILFKGAMVKAILDGTKTQTRRLVKLTGTGRVKEVGSNRNWHLDDPNAILACPQGGIGDRLWVKETFTILAGDVIYRATGEDDPLVTEKTKWKPSIFLRRVYSRITLEITAVRVERLKAITEADAKAEGVVPDPENYSAAAMAYIFGAKEFLAHTSAYATLWEQINGRGSWALNPRVWVIEFKKIQP